MAGKLSDVVRIVKEKNFSKEITYRRYLTCRHGNYVRNRVKFDRRVDAPDAPAIDLRNPDPVETHMVFLSEPIPHANPNNALPPSSDIF